ncbi:hypothetical protein [Paenibacillus crassostreae]|nr:hypothetical protein [Paenibacillus crassostreae]AOZ94664.1 hypothetical protein LPB68_10625 [Paenibacillus crassostreae]
MNNNRMTLQGLSEEAGMNKGILSAIINRSPPKSIAVSHLDRITAAMKLPEGALYDLYVDECFVTNNPNWRRLRPFILRCAAIGNYDCIEEVLERLADDLSYLPGIFMTAELLYQEGRNQAATMLYKCVAVGEKYQHSERLAMCQYRLFSLSIGQDQSVNFRATVQFEPYVDRLPEDIQLDALRELVNLYFTMEEMDKVIEISEKMVFRADCQHAVEMRKVVRTKRKIRYPVLAYRAYGYLMWAAAYSRKGNYEAGYKYTLLYTEMDWSEEREEDVHTHIAKFQKWGEANKCAFRLRLGEWAVLPDYVAYMSENEEEVLSGLLMMTESANKYDIDVDQVLNQFEDQITSFSESKWSSGYTEQFSPNRSLKFLTELGVYYLRRQRFDMGFKWILHSLQTSIRINSKSGFISCVRVFEEFRYVASPEFQLEYTRIVKEMRK